MYCNLDTNSSTVSDSCGTTDFATLFPLRMSMMMVDTTVRHKNNI